MRISMIATGGTISSVRIAGEWTNITGPELLASAVDECGLDDAEIGVEDVATGSSSDLSTSAMVRVAERIRHLLDEGSDGVVVTHGTDTVELTAFVTQLILGVGPHRPPVVFTGSMRVHSDPERDGPRNLVDAVDAARSPLCVGREVLVCVDGQLHAADRVRKIDARSLDAFSSAPFQPVGAVRCGTVSFTSDPSPRPSAPGLTGHVPIVSCFPGIDGRQLERIAVDCDALVVEAFGDLNLPSSLWGAIHELTQSGTPVVITSPCFTDCSENEGLELLGAIGGGGLTTQRARLALMAALTITSDPAEIAAFTGQLAVVHDPGTRRTRP
jgi:L-asparaginase